MSHPSPQLLRSRSRDRNPDPILSVGSTWQPLPGPVCYPALPCALPLHYVRATPLASSQLLWTRRCPRPMHLTLQCAQPGPQCLAPTHVLGLTLGGSPQCRPSSHSVPSELLKSNSSRWLLAPGDTPGSQALLLDEDRTWLMVGAKNHIVLLHLEQPGREPEKVSVGQWLCAGQRRHLALRPHHSPRLCGCRSPGRHPEHR